MSTSYLSVAQGFNAGQAAGYAVYATSGSVQASRTTAGVVEIGNGIYEAMITVPSSTPFVVVWDDTTGRYAADYLVPADVNTVQLNGQAVTAASGVTFPSSVASPTNITAGTITTVANLTNLPAITTDWISAAGVSAAAVTKIQAGLATPTNITAGTITTVANLTNLPAITTDWLTGTGVAASAVTKIQAGLSTYAGGDTSGTTTLLSRLTSTRAGYLDNIATAPPTAATIATAVLTDTSDNTTSGSPGKILSQLGAAFTTTSSSVFSTASLANAPSGGGGGLDASAVRAAIGLASANLDTQLSGLSTLTASGVRSAVGMVSANLDTQLATIYAARLDASGVRSAIGLTSANLDTQLGVIVSYIDTEVGAIKAKTDNLPASPAATSSIPTAAEVADKILLRNIAAGTDGGRTVAEALFFLRNKWVISAGHLIVYATDDSTPAWSSTVTTAASDPVTSSDPV